MLKTRLLPSTSWLMEDIFNCSINRVTRVTSRFQIFGCSNRAWDREWKQQGLDTILGLDDDRCMSRFQPVAIVWIVAFLVSNAVVAASDGPPPPGPKDRCAVCGMFVAKYPNWVATIAYPDGSHLFFDGPKDLFRYLRGEGGSTTPDAEIWVTDYYTIKPLNAREAVFVHGSDVLGPMGAEFVPLASGEFAESFMMDHGGEGPLTFDQIDAAVLRSLE